MRIFSYYNERTIGVFGRLSSGSLDLRGSLLMRAFFMQNDLCFRDCYELRISRSDNGSAQYHDQKKYTNYKTYCLMVLVRQRYVNNLNRG
jgi:hypothetical protein